MEDNTEVLVTVDIRGTDALADGEEIDEAIKRKPKELRTVRLKSVSYVVGRETHNQSEEGEGQTVAQQGEN